MCFDNNACNYKMEKHVGPWLLCNITMQQDLNYIKGNDPWFLFESPTKYPGMDTF